MIDLKKILGFESSDTNDEREDISEEQLDNEEEKIDPDDIEELDDIDAKNRQFIAPGYIEREVDKAGVGNDWVKTFFAHSWPSDPANLHLNNIFSNPTVPNDISIHVHPKDRIKVKKELQADLRRLNQQLEIDEGYGQSMSRADDREKARMVIQELELENTLPLSVSMYSLVRGDTKSNLEDNSDRFNSRLGSTASVETAASSFVPIKGMQSVSPIAYDGLNKLRQLETTNLFMSGSFAALYPFTTKTLIHDTGVEYGIQSGSSKPVIIDRWKLNNGYNKLILGLIGAGKSFGGQLIDVLRTYANRDDVVMYLLDPLGDFSNITEFLGGEEIVVGGQDQSINPFEITPPPDHVDLSEFDKDPYKQKLDSVYSFFSRVVSGTEEGDADSVLSDAIASTYEKRSKITADISTHHHESPTTQDLLYILSDMTENPEEYTQSTSESEQEKIKDRAADLLIDLKPFNEGRRYHHMGRETDIGIQDNDLVYLNLEQKEGSELGLMMQLLLEKVYQRSKETEKKVLFFIDEARYIMTSETIGFLEQTIRHSRHYDLAMTFLSQTADEFFENPAAETIADQCNMLQMHKMPGLSEEAARNLNISKEGAEFIRQAEEGDEQKGYSEALLQIDMTHYPIRVVSTDLEQLIITNSVDELLAELDEQQGPQTNI